MVLDEFWQSTIDFIKANTSEQNVILTPIELVDILPNSYPYSSSKFGSVNRFDFVIIHKGRLEQLKQKFLKSLVSKFATVFANPVFVVFSKNEDIARISQDNPDLESLINEINEIEETPNMTVKVQNTSNHKSLQEANFRDEIWNNVAKYLMDNYVPGRNIVVPQEFSDYFEKPTLYGDLKESIDNLDWIVIHKGRIEKIGIEILSRIVAGMKPVFANQVFVIFSSNLSLPDIDKETSHYQAFNKRLESVGNRSIVLEKIEKIKTNVEVISVHVPKTAGTAFGRYMREIYGQEQWLRDYEGATISEIVDSGNLTSQTKIIHGHFHARKYQGFFPEAKRVVWLRNPIVRTISWYSYCLSKPDMHPMHKQVVESGVDLLGFAALPVARNSISQFVKGTKLEDFYFIGLQEFFLEDFKELSDKLGWKEIKIKFVNKNDSPIYKEELEKAFSNSQTIKKLIELNDVDMRIYIKAMNMRAKRLGDIRPKRQVKENLKSIDSHMEQIKGEMGSLEFRKQQYEQLQEVLANL